jgi:hypothetical protein
MLAPIFVPLFSSEVFNSAQTSVRHLGHHHAARDDASCFDVRMSRVSCGVPGKLEPYHPFAAEGLEGLARSNDSKNASKSGRPVGNKLNIKLTRRYGAIGATKE